MAPGEWRPIHGFCERLELPCLFPHTDLPPDAEGDFYSIYFSRGAILEAEVLARYLEGEPGPRGPVVQVFRDEPHGASAARRLRTLLDASGAAPREHRLEDGQTLEPRFWRELVEREQPAVAVLWLRAPDLQGLAALAETSNAPRVYLSSSLVEPAAAPIPEVLRERVFFVHPFGLPDELAPGLRRTRAWLQQKGVELRAERVQANTYFAAALVRRAIKHIEGYFSRDYLVETIEHQVETATSTSLYPRSSLGRGQRFASKGSYIVKISEGSEPRIVRVSGWIVP
jgi:hypothetical protein